jgi:hypothetical protein
MFTANILPGQGFMKYGVYTEQNTVTSTGRAQTGGKLQSTGDKLLGMLVNASQKEIDQWKQNGHPITHKIIEYSSMVKAKATDYLINDHDGRQFYVQGTKNPANLNVTMIYYVEERLDLKKIIEE